MAKDYYDILGVGKDASPDDIKRAFRKLAHQHHPDKGGDPEKFKEINAAHQVLSDPQKRAQYDQFGHAAFQGGAGPGGFDPSQGFGAQGFDFSSMGFGDIFSDIFGAAAGAQRGRREAPRGRHIEMDVQVSFAEAAFGVEKDVKIYKAVRCDRCDGSGAEAGKRVSCGACNGSGQVTRAQQTILGAFRTVMPCTACDGQGSVPEKKCRDCGGQGVVRANRELSLKIPAGIDDGAVLRVSGEGEAAPRGGRAGDLYVAVRVKPDPRFTREGFDVRGAVELPVSLAALGGTVNADTIDGPVELKVPAGTQPGTVFRLRGKGIPHLGRSGRGDHLVEATVRIPKRLTREQKRFLEEQGDF